MLEQDDKGTGNDQAGTPPAGTPPAGGQFTQADLDRIVGERLTRERAKFADYDEAKKAAEELKALKASQLSETEKRDARIKELETTQKAAEEKVKAAEAETAKRLIRAEVRMMASSLGFTSPDDAYALADLVDVAIDDKGAVQGVQKALEALAKAKPYLVGKAPAGPGSPPNDPKKKGGAEADWIAEAQQRFGIKKVAQP